MRNSFVITAICLASVSALRAQDWSAVDAAMGRPSVAQPNDVHRYNFPRGDLHVTVNGVEIKPALALGGWVAMKPYAGGVMAMGDLVLVDSEVEPVLTRLQQGGVEQTAIHHHLLHDTPHVTYMHVHAHGDAVRIAQTLRAAMSATGAPAAVPAPPPATPNLMAPTPFIIDTVAIAQTLGYTGRLTGGVYQVSAPRAEAIRDGDFEVPANMGVATAINFQPTAAGRAAITGDFVLLAAEVNPVIRALRDNGIEVTSLHSHLLGEEPRLYFMHFWANDDALKLARGLRAALDQTNSKR
jgi:Domain of Unknown Function (DUF1259)